ncbi:MAG TPA: beta-propeller fold lactonase family protein [Chiayiivirga sp.]|nr:beta-propeller fold lactonase family protein [Chiayiivirga sp.]
MNRMTSCFMFLTSLLLWLGLTGMAKATIEPPDHVYYGNASLYGIPVPTGATVEARTNPEGVLLQRYTVGSNSLLGNYYKLAIPLDTIDPRKPGHARVGDPIRIFVNGLVAAEVSVGVNQGEVKGMGTTTRLDLDPQNMGTGPAISIAGTSVVEGDSGLTTVQLTVSMNAVATQAVGIKWETRNGTATGAAACANGVDFMQKISQTLTIPAGAQQGTITVQVCGDTTVELDEDFSVVLLSTVGGYGVFTVDSVATVNLIDDDNVPSLRVADVRVARPSAGTSTARFVAVLSRSHDHPVSFHWATQAGTALGGVDYVTSSGDVTIPTGETSANLDVSVLASATPVPNKSFRLSFSAPVSLVLPTTPVTATIVDPRYDPAVQEDGAVTGDQVPDLSQPTAIIVSPDGHHAYAASASKSAVLRFDRDSLTGALSNVVSYKTSSAGFDQAKLGGVQDIKLSADGAFLYVAAMGDNAVTVLARNSADGNLSFVESQVQGGAISGLKKPFRLALSPDGSQVYVITQESSSVVRFNRAAATGQLTFADSLDQTQQNLSSLGSPGGIVVSPDGAQVYITARMGNAVVTFDRNTTVADANFGRLSVRSSLTGGPAGITVGLQGAFGIDISPDGKQVYVAAQADNAVSWFDRAADGSLSFGGVIKKGQPNVQGLGGAHGVVVAPNGKEVFVTGFNDDSLAAFNRALTGAQQGDLSFHKAVFKGDNGSVLLDDPGALAASADDKFLYVAASGGSSAIVVYRRMSDGQLFKDGFEQP